MSANQIQTLTEQIKELQQNQIAASALQKALDEAQKEREEFRKERLEIQKERKEFQQERKVWEEEKKALEDKVSMLEAQLQSTQPANPTPREAANYAAAARRRPQNAPQAQVKQFPSRKDKKKQGFQNAVKSDDTQEILRAIFRQPPQRTTMEPTRPQVKEISVIAARINLSKAAQANPKHWIRKALALLKAPSPLEISLIGEKFSVGEFFLNTEDKEAFVQALNGSPNIEVIPNFNIAALPAHATDRSPAALALAEKRAIERRARIGSEYKWVLMRDAVASLGTSDSVQQKIRDRMMELSSKRQRGKQNNTAVGTVQGGSGSALSSSLEEEDGECGEVAEDTQMEL